MLKWVIATGLLAVALKVFLDCPFEYEPPAIPQDNFFGEEEIHADDVQVRSFTIEVDEERVRGFKSSFREGLTRLSVGLGRPTGAGDTLQSFSSAFIDYHYLRNISADIEKFDWKQHQYFLNTFRHYRTEIEGLRVHFVRAELRKSYERVFPLILIHSWPSSFWEFYKVIPMLSNPARFGFDFGLKKNFAFDVIVPSLPGLGFSDKPSREELSHAQIARILCKLADRVHLGSSYFVHGSGELGTSIAEAMGVERPRKVRGLHLLNPSMRTFRSPQLHAKLLLESLMQRVIRYWDSSFSSSKKADVTEGTEDITPTEDAETEEVFERPSQPLSFYATAYSKGDFSTEQWPEFFDLAVRDSAVTITSFILNRWALASDPDYELHRVSKVHSFFTLDELLTNVFISVFTDTLPSGVAIFRESARSQLSRELFRSSVNVETAILFTEIPLESVVESSTLRYRYRNITRVSVADSGGGYFAVQKPSQFAEDIFTFIERIVR